MKKRCLKPQVSKYKKKKIQNALQPPLTFKNVQKMKGHPLMRRTQQSWEKVKDKELKFCQAPIRQCPRNVNEEYYVKKNQNQKNPSTRIRLKTESLKSKAKLHLPHRSRIRQSVNTLNELEDKKHSPLTPRPKQFSSTYYLNQPKTPQPFRRKYHSRKVTDQAKTKQLRITKNPSSQNDDYQFGGTIKKNLKPINEENANITNIKQQSSTMPSIQNSLLPLLSKKDSIVDVIESALNKITLHLEILSELPEYSKQLLDLYEDNSEWEELVFLVYKKYYLQRLKIARSLRGIGPNPFQLSICEVRHEDLRKVKKSIEGIQLAKNLEAENRSILDSLRAFYNLIIEKSGNYINMEETNNFTREILKDMSTQINLLKDIGTSEANTRMKKVFKCAFLMTELQGNLVMSYEESLSCENTEKYIEKATKLFHQCLIF